MSWSIPLGSIGGTAIRLHLTFFLLLIWVGAAGYLDGGPPGATGAVSFIVLLFLCVVLHEFGHILAARRFGVHTPEILLLPIGGVSKLERIPERPREELTIAIAGPAVTLFIAIVLIVALGGLPRPESVIKEVTPRSILAQLAYANITLLVFNLLPAFPLDGGRVLRAVLAHFKGHLRATRMAASIGRVAAILLGLIALATGNFILLLIAVFVFIAAGSEAGAAQMRGILFNVPARELMISEFRSLQPDARIADAADELIRTSQTEFPVVDESGHLVGMLNRDGIIKTLTERGMDAPVSEAMQHEIPTVSERQRLHDGLDMLQRGVPAIAVTGATGQLVGLITLENLLEKLMIARAGEKRSGRRAEVTVPSSRSD